MLKKRVELSNEIATYVRERYSLAFHFKQTSGVYQKMVDCLKAWRGEDLECGAGCGNEDDDSPPAIVINITRPLVRGVTALMQRPLSKSKAQPWTIKPTPNVELSESGKERVAQLIETDLPAIMEAANSDAKQVLKVVNKVTETEAVYERSEAQKAAEKLTLKIADTMHDAGFENQFQGFLHNLSLFPLAVLKTEEAYKKRLVYSGSRVEVKTEMVRTVVNINPFDFYPAPNARSVMDTEFLVERRRVSANDLASLAGVPGYDTDAIERVFDTYPKGREEPLETAASEDGQATEATSMSYDALGYYGLLPGDMLEKWGIQVENSKLPQEAEVWIVGEVCIKAVLNPDPLGRRPFFASSFEGIPGELYGESPATDVMTTQKILSATASALVRNLAYASGPIGEVQEDRVQDDEDPRIVKPNMLRIVSRDKTHGTNAYKFHTVPSLAAELMALMEKFVEYSYTVLGIPRIAFGGPEGIGSVGRTSGGVAALLNQSSNTLFHALEGVEQNVIQPLVQFFIDHEMIYGTDLTLKGDVRAYATGISGLVEKENTGEKLQWALQSLAPLMALRDENNMPIIPTQAPVRLLFTMFKDAGIDTTGIFPDFDKQAAIQRDVPQAGGIIDGPQLDGRSANMQQAITGQNQAV